MCCLQFRRFGYVAKTMHDKRPLLGRGSLTDGVSLFVDRLESTRNLGPSR